MESIVHGLDPLLEYNKFDYDKKIYTIKQSNNPDKDYELFWLTFKNFALQYLNKSDKMRLINLSNWLDKLQKEKKYDNIKEKITEYLELNLDKLCKQIFLKKCKYSLCNILTTIKRWHIYDDNITMVFDNVTYVKKAICLVRLINKKSKHVSHIYELIYKSIINKEEQSTINKDIFIFSVKNNLSSMVKLFYYCVSDDDIYNIYKKQWHSNKYIDISGKKIIKLLKK